MDYRGLLGLLAWSALGLGGAACGLEPGASGETETTGAPSETSFDSGDEGATVASDTGGEECEPSQSDNFVVLVGVSEGVTTWSTVVPGEMTIGGVPAVSDPEGGVVFASLLLGQGSQLARHAADGTRVATLPLSALPHSLATDGSGRFVYGGLFEEDGAFQAAYGEVDLSLTPLGPERALPWALESLFEYRLVLAAVPDGTTIVAGGDSRGSGRWISKLDADGSEVWTSPWPVETEPDTFGNGFVAGAAVLADGTVGLVLTSGDLYNGNLWLEAFDPDGQHVWAAAAPARKTMGVTASVDTFVVSSEEQVDAYTAGGAEAWSTSAELRGLARQCTDTELVAAIPTGFIRFSPGGAPVAHDIDLFDIVLPMLEDYGEAGSMVQDVVCTPDGDVIVVADVDVYTSGDCYTSG